MIRSREVCLLSAGFESQFHLIRMEDLMRKKGILWAVLLAGAGFVMNPPAVSDEKWWKISADDLSDKIQGGLLGQILGNLNGLPHEMQYIAEPGAVEAYTPALPEGAWTDDDTDIEWIYAAGMQRFNQIFLTPEEIVQLWKTHINTRIWCANEYARRLMDIGLVPPWTGTFAFNPWSDFNISGQFLSEAFGLIAPGMPQTAARTGLHYTHTGIEGEPAQATQMFTGMIATAFFTQNVDEILDAGLAMLDPKSVLRAIVKDVREWHAENPGDWRATRQRVKETYSRHDGAMRDRNGYELNTASTIAALLYGGGDFVRTLVTAFNFGWDADNNAATAATIVGVIQGRRWLDSQGWNIVDRYRNTTRDAMPGNETITDYGNRLIELAGKVILEQGGRKQDENGQMMFWISAENPIPVESLPDLAEKQRVLQSTMKDEIGKSLSRPVDDTQLARAAYWAIGLDLTETMRKRYPEAWLNAVKALEDHPNLIRSLFTSPVPAAERLREKARLAGIRQPPAP
ncbi:MAG: ADP-ribosylglycohydrolase family protein [bacterium]